MLSETLRNIASLRTWQTVCGAVHRFIYVGILAVGKPGKHSVIMFNLSSNKKSSGIFVPEGNQFKEVTDPIENRSIIGIAAHLGYNPDQIRSHFLSFEPDAKLRNAVFEVFTKNIVFILTSEDVTTLKGSTLRPLIESIQYEELYSEYDIEDTLKNGVENRSLTIDFLSRILNIEDLQPDGMHYVATINRNLFFIDGVLVDFQSSDGLNKWARELKGLNPDFFDGYVQEAKRFWDGNLSKVIKEVNAQADAWAALPGGLVDNPYTELHRTPTGVINFRMMLVCHYGFSIGLLEFLEISHGRYREVRARVPGERTFQVGRFNYTFFEDGQLEHTEQVR